MSGSLSVVVVLASVCQAEAAQAPPEKSAKAARLHALYLADAAEYRLYRDAEKHRMLQLPLNEDVIS